MYRTMAISEAKIPVLIIKKISSKFSRLQLHVKLTRENFREQLLEIAAELEISRVPSAERTSGYSSRQTSKSAEFNTYRRRNHKSIAVHHGLSPF